MPWDRQYIYLAPGGDHFFHKELMMMPMDHLHCFQELLRITEKLPADNIPELNTALWVEWFYMSFHKSDHAEFVCSGNKVSEEMLQSLAEYFQSIHDVRVSDGSPMYIERWKDSPINQTQDAWCIGKKVSQQDESLHLQSWQTIERVQQMRMRRQLKTSCKDKQSWMVNKSSDGNRSASNYRIKTSYKTQKRGGWSSVQMWVTSPQQTKTENHL